MASLAIAVAVHTLSASTFTLVEVVTFQTRIALCCVSITTLAARCRATLTALRDWIKSEANPADITLVKATKTGFAVFDVASLAARRGCISNNGCLTALWSPADRAKK